MALNASGVVATVQAGTSMTVSVSNAATVPVTGLCTPGAETYASQTISYLALAAGQSVTLSLTDCNPGTGGTGGAGGAVGAGGMGARRHRRWGRHRRWRRGWRFGSRRHDGCNGCGGKQRISWQWRAVPLRAER